MQNNNANPISTIAQMLNQEITIYSFTGEHSPADLSNFSHFITTTEIPEDSELFTKHSISTKFTFPAKYLQGIHDAYLAAFRGLIHHHAILNESFGDDEYYDYLPDYIYQLIQMGAILNNGFSNTRQEIVNTLLHYQDAIELDELIECVPCYATQEAIKDLNQFANL